MDRHTVLVLNSGNDAMEAAVGDLIHAGTGGPLMRVEPARKTASVEPAVIRVRPDRLDQLYCSVAAAQHGCTVAVAALSVPALLDFLDEHRGTSGDFTSIICTVTPSPDSQRTAIKVLQRLRDIGAEASSLAVAFTQAPRDTPVCDAYAELTGYLAGQTFDGVSLEAVLQESNAFERARELQVRVAGVLNGQVEYSRMLLQAREAGAPEETIHAIARKLLAQRALLGCRHGIAQVLEALRVPGISTETQTPPLLDVPNASPPPAAPVEGLSPFGETEGSASGQVQEVSAADPA